MDILHNVGFNIKSKPDFLKAIDNIGIEYEKIDLPGPDNALINFQISESDTRWPEVSELIKNYGASDIYQTYFTEHEILNAEWLRLLITFEHGFPQPEETWVKNPINYENHCNKCGTYHQTRNFRIEKEPRLGKNDFTTFAWANAIFCKYDVIDDIEHHKIKGYKVWDAIIHRSSKPSKVIAQLYVSSITNPGLVAVDELERMTCIECGVTKYHPHMRGIMYLRHAAINTNLDMIRTHEWFGAGHSAFQEILVSNRFARLALQSEWQGLQLKVVELVD